MKFKVLGPLEVVATSGTPVRLPSAAQRRLLSLLLLRVGTTVSSDYLADRLELSGGALRTSLSRLRRIVGYDVLVTAPPGYQLRTSEVDAKEFEGLIASADRVTEGVMNAGRARALAAGLLLWRGPAYAEFAHEEWAASEVLRLHELRAGAVEELAAHWITDGLFTAAIVELEQLIAAEPFRDRPRGLLMQALAESGRRAEALRSFQAYRRFLLDELGTEPSAAVVALDRSIASSTSGTGVASVKPTGVLHPSAAIGGDASGPVTAPTGVVTFLFTDIEGSTRWWGDHPKQMNEALASHHEIVTAIFRANTGYAFASGGDGFCVAFADPVAAAVAAVEVQRALHAHLWPAPLRLRVRMGLHTGMAFERAGDYFGPTLNQAARLMSAGHGGQILVSGSLRGLLRDDLLPVGTSFRSHGTHHLPDIDDPVDVFELVAQGLVAVDRPLRTTSAALTLPAIRSSMVGRHEELQLVEALFDSHRLVTIVGSGGCGKSSLALRVAHRIGSQFPSGVFIVDLTVVDDPQLLVPSIVRSLRLDPGLIASESALVSELAGRGALIVFDNCEHLADPVADLVDRLLEISGPSVLVTSRARLELEGEHVIHLGPLDHVGADGLSEGAMLYIERASAFGLRVDSSADGVVEIELLCQQLDHLPLAIELAAANSLGLSPHQLRLEMEHPSRTGPAGRTRRGSGRRWTTVEEMVDWSYRLLDPVAQSLLRGFAPFRGPAPAEMIRRVWDPERTSSDFVAVLAQLSRLNLIAVESFGGESHYRLLETVRSLSIRRAEQAGELATLRRRHRDAYLEWSEEGSPIERARSSVRAIRNEEQIGNFRAALSYSSDLGERDMVNRQACALTSLWFLLGHADEGTRWLDDGGDDGSLEWTLALMTSLYALGDWTSFGRAQRRAVELVGERSDELARYALGFCGVAEITHSERGLEWITEGLGRAGDISNEAKFALHNFAGELLLMNDQREEARSHFAEASMFLGPSTDPFWAGSVMANTALLLILAGERDEGLLLARRSRTGSGISLLGDSRAIAVESVGLTVGGQWHDAAFMLMGLLDTLTATSRQAATVSEPFGAAAYLLAVAQRPGPALAILGYMRSNGLESRSPWQLAIFRAARTELDRHRSVPVPASEQSLTDTVSLVRTELQAFIDAADLAPSVGSD
jgi:predicted ATPase/class 3 adenylate cyclase/DNA-binding SARP family transcriptional activator